MRAGAALFALAALAAASPRAAAGPPPQRAPDAWLGPVGIARVVVEARRDRVRTTTELTLPAAPSFARDLSLFASYGAPGPPLALGAELVATPPGYLVAPDSARGERVHVRFEPSAPDAAQVIVGSRHMAGSVIELARPALARALSPGGAATLRIQAIRAMPPPAADGSRELLVRLGTQAGRPLILGSVEVRGKHVTKTSARLCDRNNGDVPLTVIPVTGPAAASTPPPLAKRTRQDALCVRLWLDQN